MSSNQEIFNNFMNRDNKWAFELLIAHRGIVEANTIELLTCDIGSCVSLLDKQIKIEFSSFDTPDIIVVSNLYKFFPRCGQANRLKVECDNTEQKTKFLSNLFLSFLIDSHISSIFEEGELEGYKTEKKNSSKDIFLDEKIAALEAIKAIRNRNRKKFKKNFKNWKKFVMISQEDIEDTVMDGDLYSEKQSTMGMYGDRINTNEEAYRKICDINKNLFNEFTVIDMIAEEVGWW